jgi:hypothetical protein
MTSLAMFVDEVQSFDAEPIPSEVAMVLSAIEAGGHPQEERRAVRRIPFRTVTQLRLFRDQPTVPPCELFTRDINRRGLGFITRHRLPLGYGGTVMLPSADHKSKPIPCTLFRCREAAPGWYEGSLCFNREQPQFDQPSRV